MSQFFVSGQSTPPPPGSEIDTLSANGGPLTPPSGTNFNFSSPDNTITFATPADGQMTATAVFPVWQVITSSQVAARSQGYIINHASGPITLTLPASPSVGDSFSVVDIGGGTFVIAQLLGQDIQLGELNTTVGPAGNLTSKKKGDSLEVICWASGPGSSWVAIDATGNISVT